MAVMKAPSPTGCPHSSEDFALSSAPSSHCLTLLGALAQNLGPANSCPTWFFGVERSWDLQSSHLQILPVVAPSLNNDQVFVGNTLLHLPLELLLPASLSLFIQLDGTGAVFSVTEAVILVSELALPRRRREVHTYLSAAFGQLLFVVVGVRVFASPGSLMVERSL